jgi:hypothetical protein
LGAPIAPPRRPVGAVAKPHARGDARGDDGAERACHEGDEAAPRARAVGLVGGNTSYERSRASVCVPRGARIARAAGVPAPQRVAELARRARRARGANPATVSATAMPSPTTMASRRVGDAHRPWLMPAAMRTPLAPTDRAPRELERGRGIASTTTTAPVGGLEHDARALVHAVEPDRERPRGAP